MFRLTYLSLSLVIQRVLSHAGYLNISPSERRSYRGRYTTSGYDMSALAEEAFGNLPVLIQIKCQKTPVSRQAVDALRGVMLRHGVSQAILICLSRFSPQARAAAATYTGRPVRLIDGMDLARMMVGLGIGVDGDARTSTKLDEDVFKRLERFTVGLKRKRGAIRITTRNR